MKETRGGQGEKTCTGTEVEGEGEGSEGKEGLLTIRESGGESI